MTVQPAVWWPFRVIGRLQNTFEILLLPLRLLGLICEIVLGLSFVGLLAIGYGVYTHKIPPSEIASILNQVGGGFLSVLKAQGIY